MLNSSVLSVDRYRLMKQETAVGRLMSDGKKRSLRMIVREIGQGTEASVSARLRDLDKDPKYPYKKYKTRNSAGLYLYQMLSFDGKKEDTRVPRSELLKQIKEQKKTIRKLRRRLKELKGR